MYKYFSEKELSCKCGCGKDDMNPVFMEMMDEIREYLGTPLTVTSAYRCPEYNKKVSTTGLNGPHTTGKAIDIKASSKLKLPLLLAARYNGCSRFGVGKTFLHIDSLGEEDGFSEEVIWTY